jgi:H/ACA ribonucleoprotein complex subunit 3
VNRVLVHSITFCTIMYLMYYLNENGERVYTMAKVDPSGKPTISAHPGEWTAD